MGSPAVDTAGCTPILSLSAPGSTEKRGVSIWNLVLCGIAVNRSMYPTPSRPNARFVNVAMPLLMLALRSPMMSSSGRRDSGLITTSTVGLDKLSPVSKFPALSRNAICGCTVKASPAIPWAGCRYKTICMMRPGSPADRPPTMALKALD